MEETYIALFLVSFLAATIVPLGSEWLLASMIIAGNSLPATVAVASSGNYLGSVTTYLIGIFGGLYLMRNILKIDEEKESRAKNFYKKYGSWTLLLSWLPVIGDAFCLVGGMAKVNFIKFSLLVFSGKAARYLFVALAASEGSILFR